MKKEVFKSATTLVTLAQEQFDLAELSFTRCCDKEYEEAAEKIAQRLGLRWQWSPWGGIEFEENLHDH